MKKKQNKKNKKKGPKNKSIHTDKCQNKKEIEIKKKKKFKSEPISNTETTDLIKSIKNGTFHFSEDEEEDLENYTPKEKRYRLYNKNFEDGKILSNGEILINQKKNKYWN